jgi:hypothetical protein
MRRQPWRSERAPSRTARSRRVGIASALVAIGAAAILVNACVIADPPTDLPRLPDKRATIVRASVVPSTTSVLGSWPTKVIIPVELSDSRATLKWAAFVDYNPATGEGYDSKGESNEATSTNGNIRTLEIPITTPSSDRCHIVEVIVALNLNLNTTDSRTLHTPEPPGGDSVSWFYSPSGDLAGCPVLDAGLNPRVDSDAEAGAVEAGGSSR